MKIQRSKQINALRSLLVRVSRHGLLSPQGGRLLGLCARRECGSTKAEAVWHHSRCESQLWLSRALQPWESYLMLKPPVFHLKMVII